ncbi:MAG: galactosyltransferase-related protein [Candidatus Peregrinibacteria bacterium]
MLRTAASARESAANIRDPMGKEVVMTSGTDRIPMMRLFRDIKSKVFHSLARRFPPPPVPLSDYEVEEWGGVNSDVPFEGGEGISAITAVMDRTENLLQAIPTWLQHEQIKEVIVVDWSSRLPVREALEQCNDRRIRVIRVDNQRRWVQPWAFNLAAHFSRCSTLLKIDADDTLSPDFFALHRLDEKEFISGHFRAVGRGLGGLLLIRRQDFFAVNGYNEHIVAYGGDDDDLHARLVRTGYRQRFFVRGSCAHIPHSDRMRLKYLKLRIPIREVSGLHNSLKFHGKNLWSFVRNNLEISRPSCHSTVVSRYRGLSPAAYLRDLGRGWVDYYRVSGNWGDSLIAEAGRQLLGGLNIPFNEYLRTAPERSQRSTTAVIKGGGGLVDLYHLNRDFLTSIIGEYSRVILLPITFAGEKQRALLRSLGEHVTIFCREKQSYDFIKQHWVHANEHLFLWHDVAMDFDYAPYQHTSGTGILNAFRTDSERTDHPLPADNVDLSLQGDVSTPIDPFLRTIASKRQVNTNRLHVAIAAACMGKDVNLFPNNYYKNRAVYEYSLQQYPNVRWKD